MIILANNNSDSGLRPPKFSLRGLLLLTAAFAAFIAIWNSFGPVGGTVFLLLSSIIFLHVAGNAIGRRLQQSSAPQRVPNAPATATSEKSIAFARVPATRLSHHTPLGSPLVVSASLGLVLGGLGGYPLMVHFYGNQMEVVVICISVISGAVLGGLGGFWIWSFFHVLFGAWKEAHRGTSPSEKPFKTEPSDRRE